MSTSSFNGSLYPQNQRTNNVFAFSKVRRLDFWRVMFFIKAPLSFGRKKNTHDLTPHHRYLGGVKNRNGSSHLKWRNDWFVIFSLFKFILPWKNPKHPQGSPGGSFFYTRPVDNITHPKNKKKGACFPSPRKLGRTSTPSIFPLAVLPPCHSYLAAGSRLRSNAAHRWCAWSRWDPGTWETDPAPGCAVRMRRWWEMCRLVIFFLNSIDQTMSVQWNLPLVASSPLAASPTSSCKVFHHTICILTSPFVSSFAARTRSSMKRL